MLLPTYVTVPNSVILRHTVPAYYYGDLPENIDTFNIGKTEVPACFYRASSCNAYRARYCSTKTISALHALPDDT